MSSGMGWNIGEVGLSGLTLKHQILLYEVGKQGPKLLFLFHKHSYLDHLQKKFFFNLKIIAGLRFFLAFTYFSGSSEKKNCWDS